jgi:hypothetical protein
MMVLFLDFGAGEVAFMSRDSSSETNRNPVAFIAAAAVGIFASQYFGLTLFVPFGMALVAFLVLSRLMKMNPVKSALIALLIGQIGWFCAAVAVAPAQASQVWLDILILLLFASWLFLKPGKWAAIGLMSFEFLAGLVNLASLLDTTVHSGTFKALIIHVLVRLAVIAACVAFLRDPSRKAVAIEPATFD